MTNIVLGVSLMTIVATNWVDISGDFKREGGTNYVQQRLVVETNIYLVEIRFCTNMTLVNWGPHTNGPTRWVPQNPLPPLPNMPTKE